MDFEVTIRPMSFADLEAVYSIDKEVRKTGKVSITYKDFTTQQVLGAEIEKTTTNGRLDKLEVAKLVDLGLIAEYQGEICGFVLGRQTYVAEHNIEVGEIAIMGVLPDYQGKLVATELVDRICHLFRSRGVHKVRIGLDPSDKELQAFFGRFDFRAQRIVYYDKTL
jgi:ribosomal protein S18 acetylase RimI-like enzyme